MPTNTFPGIVPGDWVRALELHVDFPERERGVSEKKIKKTRNARLRKWLHTIGGLSDWVLETNIISTIRNTMTHSHGFDAKENRHGEVLCAIQDNIPATPVLKHLANMRYRAEGFYAYDRPVKKSDDIEGIYLARRLSFAAPGKINVSAFRFHRDRQNRPFYKEKRIIDVPDKGYHVRTRGCWFPDRGAFSLIGMSFELLGPNPKEADAGISAVGNIYDDRILLHHNNNPNVLRGIYASVIKDTREPVVTEIALQKLDIHDEIEAGEYWGDIEDETNILGTGESIGVRSPKRNERDTLVIRKPDPKYFAPVVRTDHP
jgi:hypothetical protein